MVGLISLLNHHLVHDQSMVKVEEVVVISLLHNYKSTPARMAPQCRHLLPADHRSHLQSIGNSHASLRTIAEAPDNFPVKQLM